MIFWLVAVGRCYFLTTCFTTAVFNVRWQLPLKGWCLILLGPSCSTPAAFDGWHVVETNSFLNMCTNSPREPRKEGWSCPCDNFPSLPWTQEPIFLTAEEDVFWEMAAEIKLWQEKEVVERSTSWKDLLNPKHLLQSCHLSSWWRQIKGLSLTIRKSGVSFSSCYETSALCYRFFCSWVEV